MKNILFMSIIAMFGISTSYSQELDSFGWEKSVDDFEGTASFTKQTSYGMSCPGWAVTQVIGGVQTGVPGVLMLGVILNGEDSNEIEEFQWRTEDGNQSLDILTCNAQISGGLWSYACIIPITSKETASSISTSDFIRLNGQRANIDLIAANTDCSILYNGIKEITSEYSKSD